MSEESSISNNTRSSTPVSITPITGSKKAWLLRLFQSEFFDAWIALSYLFKYADLGIQEYLCQRMREFSPSDVEFILPQLCHLLLLRPLSSASLENLLLELCQVNSHFAVMMMWYLEGYLNDLKQNPDQMCLYVCSKVYGKCHAMLLHSPRTEPGSSSMRPFMYPFHRTKITERLQPAILGLSYCFASFGHPDLLDMAKRGALIHGRQKYINFASKVSKSRTEEEPQQPPVKGEGNRLQIRSIPKRAPSLEDMHNGDAFSVNQYMAKSTALPTSGSMPNVENVIHTPAYYLYSEFHFINLLIDISIKLVPVPKADRPRTLQAELTLVNHNLPADVCLPFWCEASVAQPHHHKIVRIPPSEAVTLNSAERVPFLLLVEVLECESRPIEQLKYLRSHPNTELSGVPQSPKIVTNATPSASALPPNRRRRGTSFDKFNESMKSAAIMLAQLDPKSSKQTQPLAPEEAKKIREKILKEMHALEARRLAGGLDILFEEDDNPNLALAKEDPSAAVFQEKWVEKVSRIRQTSPFGHLSNWRLLSVIVKSGADLRQEQLACQLIREMQLIWQESDCPCWVYYFQIMSISDSSGLIETIRDSISVHSIKKNAYANNYNPPGVPFTLYHHFLRNYGEPTDPSFISAQTEFMKSLAGYSLVTYLLQLRDRHNGNILVDTQGHLIHIDFGFMLSNSPGAVGFEQAPFKLPQEYVDILGGTNTPVFESFKALMLQGFLALRKHADRLVLMVEIMQKRSHFPCFQQGDLTITNFRDRFQTSMTDAQAKDFIDKLVHQSFSSVYTRLYDSFQYYSNGIL